jgi:hypothetical protein
MIPVSVYIATPENRTLVIAANSRLELFGVAAVEALTREPQPKMFLRELPAATTS